MSEDPHLVVHRAQTPAMQQRWRRIEGEAQAVLARVAARYGSG